MNKILSESEFIAQLTKRASEQKRVSQTEILPRFAKGMGEWLVVNPWRVLIPLSLLIYLGLRVVVGVGMREVVLAIFGGF